VKLGDPGGHFFDMVKLDQRRRGRRALFGIGAGRAKASDGESRA
jgi:hypothetical protein